MASSREIIIVITSSQSRRCKMMYGGGELKLSRRQVDLPYVEVGLV